MRVQFLPSRAVRGFIIFLIGAASGSISPAHAQTTNQAAGLPRTLPELRAELDAIVDQHRYHAATWSVKIVSLATGKTVYENHGDRLMSPASNSKLYTGALALGTLGGDYRIVTPILATARPDGAGIVNGDLIISGRGDPGWHAADFQDNFTPFVTALTNAGVRRVTGDLVADATFYHGLPYGSGWAIDDLGDNDGAKICALTLEDNGAEIRVSPGAKPGDPCSLQLSYPDTGIILVNRTHTVPAGSREHLDTETLPGSKTFYVTGDLAVGANTVELDAPVPDPAAWFGAVLKQTLADHGITVEGNVRSVAWPEVPTWKPADLVLLGEVKSMPLRDLVRGFMKPSQNLENDLIFEHVGECSRTAETPSGETSEGCALRALARFLAKNQVPPDVHFDEGSGLSRNNLTSANATAALLAVMAAGPEARDYYNALPIAGVDGTLRRRMKNTPAAGNVHAKTGTLRWANSLSGYVTTAAGEKLAFSMMLNRYEAPDVSHTADFDKIAALLAGFTGRADE